MLYLALGILGATVMPHNLYLHSGVVLTRRIGQEPAQKAEAIRFAIEDFPTMRTLGAWMQVGDERFDGDAIQRLYDSSNYPLQRRPPTGD